MWMIHRCRYRWLARPRALRIQRRLSMIEFRFLIAAAAVGMGVLITDPAIGTATPLTPISSSAITKITERSGGIEQVARYGRYWGHRCWNCGYRHGYGFPFYFSFGFPFAYPYPYYGGYGYGGYGYPYYGGYSYRSYYGGRYYRHGRYY